MGWLGFALLTVVQWGLYGVLLHTGQLGMADPVAGRYKAFLFVGMAYVLTAIVGPLVVLSRLGASWSLPAAGMGWSFLAGIVGAGGAFCVLLAFGAKGTPAAVMSIVFAGAPIVNAFVAMLVHPPAGGIGALRWQFLVGIALAALGGFLVTAYKPPPAAAAAAHGRPPAGPAAEAPAGPGSAASGSAASGSAASGSATGSRAAEGER